MQFWISIFPIPAITINKSTSLCRNFLWTGEVHRSKYALIAWKQVCLPKDEALCGRVALVQQLLSNWHSGMGFFYSQCI